MLSADEFQKRIATFPQRYWENFDEVWNWKLTVETEGSAHILDENHREETYYRLCKILPRWQTYRMGDSSEPLRILKESLDKISEAYAELRRFTLLDFKNIPHETLETIWHELGRAKEREGRKKETGCYYIIAVTKPLLLIWGQTLAFDREVRKHAPKDYSILRYSWKWNLPQWTNVMEKISKNLNADLKAQDMIKKETEKRYKNTTIIPYGRFLDAYYWKGPCS